MSDYHESTPEGDAIAKAISDALYDLGNHNFTNRARPYDGQPLTDEGERGKTLVQGLTFRDVRDCFRRAWFIAQGRRDLLESPDCTENAIYSGPDVDPIAVMKEMSCEMERMMGIFPNVPKLTRKDEEGTP